MRSDSGDSAPSATYTRQQGYSHVGAPTCRTNAWRCRPRPSLFACDYCRCFNSRLCACPQLSVHRGRHPMN
jgi:hypothetical protein